MIFLITYIVINIIIFVMLHLHPALQYLPDTFDH